MSESAPSLNSFVWLNGSFTPMREARISPLDRGFLYGDGFFETIRAERGRALYLQLHLQRLNDSLAAFRIALDPPPPWEALIGELLERNMLMAVPSSVKIIVTRGIASAPGLPAPEKPTVCISAQEYVPPSADIYERGWDLHILKSGYPPPLAPFKTLNYLYYLRARQAAFDAGCHEAILTDHDGRVTETSAGSILAKTGGRWWTPESAHRLKGATLHKAAWVLEQSGEKIDPHPAWPEDIYSADTVWVLNSLIGIMPVYRVDGHLTPDPASKRASVIRRLMFEAG